MKHLAIPFMIWSVTSVLSSPFSKAVDVDKDKPLKTRAKDVSAKPFQVGCKSYVVIKESLFWDEGRQKCNELGGDLASVFTYKEFEGMIQNIRFDKVRWWIWLGGQLKGPDPVNDWFWVSGEPIPSKFGKWKNDGKKNIEPEAKGPISLNGDCVVIRRDGNRRENNGPSLATVPCNSTSWQSYSLCQLNG